MEVIYRGVVGQDTTTHDVGYEVPVSRRDGESAHPTVRQAGNHCTDAGRVDRRGRAAGPKYNVILR